MGQFNGEAARSGADLEHLGAIRDVAAQKAAVQLQGDAAQGVLVEPVPLSIT